MQHRRAVHEKGLGAIVAPNSWPSSAPPNNSKRTSLRASWQSGLARRSRKSFRGWIPPCQEGGNVPSARSQLGAAPGQVCCSGQAAQTPARSARCSRRSSQTAFFWY